jgi:DNA polymerase III sliding clamp (beta) subunit (PCNA family)
VTAAFRAIVPVDPLRQYLDVCATVLDEAVINVSTDGLRTAGVDPANVAMADVTLDAAAFESLDVDASPDDPVQMGVPLAPLDDTLGLASSGDLVELELQDDGRLWVRVGNLERTLALIDIDAIRAQPDMPEVDYSASFTFEGRVINRATKAADMVGDRITFEAGPESLVASAEGDTDDVELRLGEDDLEAAHVAADAHGESVLLSLDYLKSLKPPVPSDAAVSLTVKDDHPIKLRYQFAEGKGSVEHMVAPRIQS